MSDQVTPTTGEERLLTVPEIAGRLGVDEQTIRRWIRSGQLPAIKLGDKAGYRVRQSRLEHYLTARETGSRVARQLLDAALAPAPAPARTVDELEQENAELRRRLDELEVLLAAASDR